MGSIQYTEFQQKVVFVTGGASGIGFAQVSAFLSQGAKVYVLDNQLRDLELFKIQYPTQFDYYLGDVQEKAVLVESVKACNRLFGRIDILLNTVGVLDNYLPLLETSEATFDRIFTINVKSLFLLTKFILPQMLEQGNGTIITMTSIAGLVAGGGGVAYTMSKHALVGFIKQLALDYAAQGIHVNGIAPGAIETPMNAADFAGEGLMAKQVAEETPLKRWAQPKEVADLTLFLASKQANYMQGTIIPIDGGWTLK